MAATINLRAFPYSEQVNCPHCQKPITVYDPEGSDYIACNNCHWYSKLLAPKYYQAQQSVAPVKQQPLLPIGAEGTLRGTPYKVIGYLEKHESGNPQYEWREYMLYNYTKGYAFLAEYDGHWSYIAGKMHFTQLNGVTADDFYANMDGAEYKIFNRYTPIVTALIGEFDWDVYAERVFTREFINPPYLLVEEKDKKNAHIVDWYLGEYIEPEEIADVFKLDVDNFPEANDIGANQPNPYKMRWVYSIWISIVAAVILIAIQITVQSLRPDNLIMDKQIELTLPPPPIDTAKHDTTKLANPLSDSLQRDSIARAATTNLLANINGNYEFKSLKTSSFTINGPSPVEVSLSAPLDNNWAEATIELVNEKDNQTWDVSKEIEYYHGYEDGESWSEGSNSESTLLNDIPPGTYHINIYPYAGTNSLSSINVKVEANVILWQNILVTLCLLCLYPLYCWYTKRRFEINRWMGNYYSPYKQTKSDD